MTDHLEDALDLKLTADTKVRDLLNHQDKFKGIPWLAENFGKGSLELTSYIQIQPDMTFAEIAKLSRYKEYHIEWAGKNILVRQ